MNRELWSALDEAGLTRLTESTETGGSGASWREAAALLSSVPSTWRPRRWRENDLLAGFLLAARRGAPDGLCEPRACSSPSGVAVAVPWAGQVERIVVAWPGDGGWRVADVPASEVTIERRYQRAFEPRDRVR